MAMAISTNLNLVLTFCIPTVLFLLFVRWLKKGRSLPPGPFGLPLLGNLPFLSPDLHRCFADLSRTYGPVMTIRLGCRPCVVLSSSSAAREALRDNDLTFASHDVPAAALAAFNGINLVWNPYGPVWRMLRKMSVREVLSASSLEAVRPLRRREVQRMVETIHAKEGSAVEVRELVFLTTLSVMFGMLWGGTVNDEGAGNEFKEAMDGIMECLGKANVSDLFPVLAPLDIQGVAKQIVRFRDSYFRVFDSILEDRRNEMDANEGGGRDGKRDFLQVMLELLDKGGDSQVPLKIDQVKGVFFDLVAGGTDTTSTTVEWAIAEILNNPDIMKKVQDELDEVVGKNRCVEESDIPRLPYLNAVMKEVFRLHPVVPLLVPYSPSSSCTVGGFSIPKGTKVFINVWAIHREPSVWKDALKFEPERFLSGNDKYDYSGNNFNYLTFGSGRRICPGIPLAENMVMYLLASLLHPFEWRLPKGTEMNLKEHFGIVLKKDKHLVAIPSGRLSKTIFSA
ncbi:putative flavonoid 3'-monooxygenase [Iris pallida]|uniref:Flavonoid 3'-monooxygenase n=1 Tax=Iris pallida TaxID=29817 RepID=A0AAX6HLA0_IRIPA|nr:putative flavonoid 3'-monooxygenase [Iris pallida]